MTGYYCPHVSHGHRLHVLLKSQSNQHMTATAIRDYFSDSNIVAEIVRELNMEIGFCPILRNLKREKDCVIDNDSITFRELGSEDRNEVFVYLGRILESVLTSNWQSVILLM